MVAGDVVQEVPSYNSVTPVLAVEYPPEAIADV